VSEPVRAEVVKALILAGAGEREQVAAELGATVEEVARALAGWLNMAALALDGAGSDPAEYTYHELRVIVERGQAAELLLETFPRWITEPTKRASDVLKTASPDLRRRAEVYLRDLE